MNNQNTVERVVIGGDVHVTSLVVIEGEIQPTREQQRYGDLPYWGFLEYRGTCIVLNPKATGAEIANTLAQKLSSREGFQDHLTSAFWPDGVSSSEIKLQGKTTFRWESLWSARRNAGIDLREFVIRRRDRR